MIYIDRALITQFLAGNFNLPIAHENQSPAFVPVAGAPYAEIIVLQNDVTPLSLAHSNQSDGVFRVILRYPADSGAVAAKLKADEILGFYKLGTRLNYDGDALTITGNARHVGSVEYGWYKLVLTVSYKAFFGR